MIIKTMDGSRTYKSEKGQDRAVHGHNHLVVSATFTTVDAELQLPDIDDYVPRNTSWHVVTLTDPPLFHGRYCLTTCQISWHDFTYMIFVFIIIIIMFTSIETRLTDSFLSHFIIKGYIGEFEIIDDHRSNKIVVELNGRLNKCGVISPRFDVGYDEIEKWVVNLLPSRQFGHILISTTYGIMTHEEARRKKTGGKILGFFYWRGRPWLLK